MNICRKSCAVVCLLACNPAPGQNPVTASPEDLLEAGHFKRAHRIAEERLRQNPNDARALYIESRVAESFGDLPRAIETGERSVSIDARNPDYLGQLAQAYARMADRSSLVRGIVYVHKLRKQLDTALAINPRHIDTLLVDMMYLWKAPMVAGGDRRKALSIAEKIERIDAAWGYLAEARLAQDGADDAKIEQLLVHAVQANRLFYRAHVELATFYCCFSRVKRFDAAIREANDAEVIDAGQVGAYDVLARTYASQERWADLDAVLLESARNVPDDLTPYYQAARILIASNVDLPRAERYLRKYLSQQPEGRAPTISDSRKLLASIPNGGTNGRIRAD